jgi:hypothetical protein
MSKKIWTRKELNAEDIRIDAESKKLDKLE